MPYRSKKQAAFIHAEAERGVPWARKFVKDAKGSHVVPRLKRPSALAEEIRSHLTRSGKLRGNR